MKTAPISATLIDYMGSDLSVVNAARVSFEKESVWANDSDGWLEGTLQQSDVKLIAYLAKHKHFSPFNHAFLSFRVKAPIFVARQLVKHKFMPWNEVSRRYVDTAPEFYMPDAYRAKADNVKQGSSEKQITVMCHHDMITGEPWECDIADSVYNYTEYCLNMYSDLLTAQVCPEQARLVLPANMMTEWIWSGTLGAFADMLKLRRDPHSQKESRDVANLIYEQMLPLFPVSLTALLENK